MIESSTVAGWIIRGLEGVADILAGCAWENTPIDGDHLKSLRATVVRLASHYNYHAKRSSLEPHERPPFWGSDYPVGGMCSDGPLDPTQPLPSVAAAAERDSGDGTAGD